MKFVAVNLNNPKIDLFEDKTALAKKIGITVPTLNKYILFAENKSIKGKRSIFFNHKGFMVFYIRNVDIHKSKRGNANKQLNFNTNLKK